MARLSETHNLQVINPRLAKEWHPTKNGTLTPRDVTPKTETKVWWKCKDGHEWKARAGNRSSGTACPYCSKGSLATVNPVLSKKTTSDSPFLVNAECRLEANTPWLPVCCAFGPI